MAGRVEATGLGVDPEQVSSATPSLHPRFLDELGITPEQEDAGNILLDPPLQFEWLRAIGLVDVDRHWER